MKTFSYPDRFCLMWINTEMFEEISRRTQRNVITMDTIVNRYKLAIEN